MREKWRQQMPLTEPTGSHPQEQELEAISRIINATPTIVERVLQDLRPSNQPAAPTGANGMSAEQVLRAAIAMFLFGFTYEELAFHLTDSRALRKFCGIGIADKGFKKSALNKNIKRLSPETWEAIGRDIVSYARHNGIEKGRKVRIDATVVETPIHTPSDSSLLWDCVRVLTRLVQDAGERVGGVVGFSDSTRRAKRRLMNILNAKKPAARKAAYKDLLKVTGRVCTAAERSIEAIATSPRAGVGGFLLGQQLQHYLGLALQVIEQTDRRVFKNESVPAGEKIVSIFEEHTDIICKDNRDTYYGHKICLTGGASNLILDCAILKGNPADTTLVETMLDRQKEIYGRYPLKVALDGGFASKENLAKAKAREIKDVCFAKKRGLSETEMCRSQQVYRKLRRFRAGIESGISWLKRSFGLDRCTWKGWRSFKSYVHGSIAAANLLTIARKQLTAQAPG